MRALTPLDSVTIAPCWPTFYLEIRTPLVAMTVSDSSDFSQVPLGPGTYSVFTRENSLLYINGFDGYGNIRRVIVIGGGIQGVRCDINYAATHCSGPIGPPTSALRPTR